MSALFAYAKNAKGELGLSVVLSVVSILLGLVPFFCMYRVICLFTAGTGHEGCRHRLVCVVAGSVCGQGAVLHPFHRHLSPRGLQHSGRAALAAGGAFSPCAAGRGAKALHRRDQEHSRGQDREHRAADPENEDKIQQSIAALTKGKTLLVIAHRLSTIKNADNIVVLQNGSILAEGTQEQLLADCPLYRDMWQAHIGAKAWAVSSAGKEEINHVQNCQTHHRLVRRI